ncbi:hypothetical protein FOCC_FOCC002878 [Frankliniella occidentalis]|nr:hypothetical protein FOCC_FOCC002878 [Frankliniella occidentalis]
MQTTAQRPNQTESRHLADPRRTPLTIHKIDKVKSWSRLIGCSTTAGLEGTVTVTSIRSSTPGRESSSGSNGIICNVLKFKKRTVRLKAQYPKKINDELPPFSPFPEQPHRNSLRVRQQQRVEGLQYGLPGSTRIPPHQLDAAAAAGAPERHQVFTAAPVCLPNNFSLLRLLERQGDARGLRNLFILRSVSPYHTVEQTHENRFSIKE